MISTYLTNATISLYASETGEGTGVLGWIDGKTEDVHTTLGNVVIVVACCIFIGICWKHKSVIGVVSGLAVAAGLAWAFNAIEWGADKFEEETGSTTSMSSQMHTVHVDALSDSDIDLVIRS